MQTRFETLSGEPITIPVDSCEDCGCVYELEFLSAEGRCMNCDPDGIEREGSCTGQRMMTPQKQMLAKAAELKAAGVDKATGKTELFTLASKIYASGTAGCAARMKGYKKAVYHFCGEHVGL